MAKVIACDHIFDEYTGEEYLITEDKSMKWNWLDVEACDWKDHECQADAIEYLESKGEDIVELFDGSDTTIYASMADVIIPN